MTVYRYTVDGIGRHGATWFVEGTIHATGEFLTVPARALHESYEKLTEGRAVYGDQTTCQGPYTIRRLTIIREDTHDGVSRP